MTARAEELLAQIITAHGGELVGRIRLQKVVYLLDQLGLHSDFEYGYHHYGPYSAELSAALIDAQAEGLVIDEQRFRKSDGASYSVFKANRQLTDPAIGDLSCEKATSVLDRLKRESATVLELAATIHWLREVEGIKDWAAELVSRKGAKTGDGRQDKALKLLGDIGLEA